jgi:hypothetical protein
LTVLDLIQRESMLGGMGRVREVLRGLWPQCTPRSLTLALDAMQSVPVAQRLGVLLALDDQVQLVAALSGWLRDKPMRLIPLAGGLPAGERRIRSSNNIDSNFKVWIPSLQGANT